MISFYLCDTIGFLRVMNLIKSALNLLRFVIPIILIIMVAKDMYSGVINPDNKDNLKKVKEKVIAAVVVFLVPTLISLVFSLIDIALGNASETDYTVSSCYTNANQNCIEKINSYLDCGGYEGEQKKKCLEFRSCNSYHLTNSCEVIVDYNDSNCAKINQEVGTIYGS